MELERVSQMLGHANIKITSDIYGHLDFDDVWESYNRNDPFRWIDK
jgi:site-specific recombinase XerC